MALPVSGSIIRRAEVLITMLETAFDNSNSQDQFHEKLTQLLEQEIAEAMSEMDQMSAGKVYRLAAPRNDLAFRVV